MMELPIKPQNSRFTDGQWQAVYEEGHNILVSASAGSGKTTVLVQRVIEKIKAGVNVDELLIVTYTEAAAREMKARIQVAIQKAITGEGDVAMKQHLVKQVPLLPQASISTLHAFCLQVIRRYYYLIDLDPVFRLLTDETEMLLLKEDVWSDLREELYGTDDNDFYALTATYSNDRNDDGLTRLIFSLYEFSRANPNPRLWLEHLSDLYRVDSGDLADTKLFKELLKPQIIESLYGLIATGQKASSIAEGTEELTKQHELVFSETLFFEELLESIMGNHYETAYNQLSAFKFERIATVKKAADESIKEAGAELKALRDQYKERYNQLVTDYFTTSPQEMSAIMEKATPLVDEMARVTQLFTEAYSKEKRRQNVLDFNDLEHLTLEILANFEGNTWSPTEASNYYREKFSEVLVDEYQDVNQLQENIIRWLSSEDSVNGNLFMVGDVKQSIYSFRLADPSLFLTKYEKFGQHIDGERIILAENFRSRGEVLHFTNLIFEQLMDKSVGQLFYDEDAKLIHGFPDFPETNCHQPELLIYEKGSNEDTDSEEVESVEWDMRIDDKTEGELLMVAQRIQQLIAEKFPIYDKDKKVNRPISYRDIVLLTPTKKNNLILLDVFKRMSVPIHVSDTQNYFQTTEIKIMMALLKIIDNPYQDIPLAAVLRSPIVALDENQLASIRITKKTGDYYAALENFYKTYQGQAKASHFDTILFEKVKRFMEQLENWRRIARREQLVTLIWTIYEDTGFLDYVGGMSSGKQRQANLHALYQRAESYEVSSFKGLFQFVRFIEKMQEKDKDLAEPTAISASEDAVRVMTIHGSKGLEFPVVFVLDLTKRFNLQDIQKSYLFNEDYGVGTSFKDLERRISYTTLPEVALKIEKKKKLLSEEMRKLYVAVTRAEEKLFLVGSYKNEESAWLEWGQTAHYSEAILPSSERFNASSLMKWIGMSLVRHPDGKNDYLEIPAKIGSIWQHPARFKISFHNESSIRENIQTIDLDEDSTWLENLEVQAKNNDKHQNDEAIQLAVKRMEYEYTHESATRTTSYQSVSEIKRLFEEPENARMVKIDVNKPRNRFVSEKLSRPKFMSDESEPSAAEIGTATHLIMQNIDLTQIPTKESVKDLIATFVAKGLLTDKLATKIQVDAILVFFTTELGELMLKKPKLVTREAPFSLLMDAEKIFTDMHEDASDKLLIHGIIDGFLEEEDGLILYDFKTDYVDQNSTIAIEKISKNYRGQMNLYREALENISGKPVKAAYLCLLSIGKTLLIEK